MDNIFYIKNVPIQIVQTTPTKIDYNNNNKVIEIETILLFTYKINFIEEDIKEYKKLTINIEDASFGKFIPFNELTKELFYSIVINEANKSQLILNKVTQINCLLGLESQEEIANLSNKNQNFNLVQPFK